MNSSFLSSFLRNLLFLSSFLLSRDTRADEPPKITLERIVDGRGNRVCDVARATGKSGELLVQVRLVRGLVRPDVVLRHETHPGADGKEIGTDEIRLGDGSPLRFEGGAPGSRVSASSPVSTFRYFDADAGRKTVRCNLSRLVEETDRELLSAAAEYALMKQSLGEPYGPDELPVLTLLTVEKRPQHPSPPTRRKIPLPGDAPETEPLRAAVLAALDAR